MKITSQKRIKEIPGAIVTTTIFAILIFGYNFFRQEHAGLIYQVSVFLFPVILFAGFFGTMIPFVLHKFKTDPALVAGPFIKSMNDISELFIYFTVAKYVFGVI